MAVSTVTSLTHLRAMLSTCTAFWAWTAEPDAANAIERIHLWQLPAPARGDVWTRAELERLRPFAVVRPPEGVALEWSMVAHNSAAESGRGLEIYLEQTIPGKARPYVPTDDLNTCHEAMEEIVRGNSTDGTTGILDKCHPAAAGHLDCGRVRLRGPFPSDFRTHEETGRYFWAVLEVDFP